MEESTASPNGEESSTTQEQREWEDRNTQKREGESATTHKREGEAVPLKGRVGCVLFRVVLSFSLFLVVLRFPSSFRVVLFLHPILFCGGAAFFLLFRLVLLSLFCVVHFLLKIYSFQYVQRRREHHAKSGESTTSHTAGYNNTHSRNCYRLYVSYCHKKS